MILSFWGEVWAASIQKSLMELGTIYAEIGYCLLSLIAETC